MKKILVLTAILFLALVTGKAMASPEREVVTSSVIYRGDGQGTYLFKGSARLNGTGINQDGSVEYLNSPGTYELTVPYKISDLVSELTMNWKFSGKVTMEVSATGKNSDYVKVTNGVPLKWGEFSGGTDLKWRATLAPDSRLTEVKVDYADISGKGTGWGSPELSGYKFRKPIFIKGSEAGELFNYQITIKVGESNKAGDYDVSLKNLTESDFQDVCFTQADKETLLSFYRESVAGYAPNRVAAFWVKIPQLPKDGLLVYLYYGKSNSADLSNGFETFDLFDDFQAQSLDINKWELGTGKIASVSYKLKDGIIEYRAKANSNTKVGVIVKGDDSTAEDINLKVFSSDITDEQHSIYKGKDKKVNAPGAISGDTYYNYRATSADTTLTYQRFNDDWTQMLAGVEYSDPAGLTKGYIGIASSPAAPRNDTEGVIADDISGVIADDISGVIAEGGTGVIAGDISGVIAGDISGVIASPEGAKQSFAWLRVRQLAEPKPEIDSAKTESALVEIPNLANFSNCIVAGNGDLVLSGQNTEGEYLSSMIYSTLPIRIMVPSWQAATGGASSLTAGISATAAAGEFKKDCVSENYYYASKKDFKAGKSLKWKVALKRLGLSSDTSRLREFSLDYRPGIITLVKPDGKEIIKAGANYEIDWSAWEYEPSYKMKLEYSLDGGKNYNLIVKDADNDGHYLWGVPNKLTESAIVKISDALEPTIYDLSNATFAIAKEGDFVSLPGEASPVSLRGEAEAISLDLEKVLAAAKAAAGITGADGEAPSVSLRSAAGGEAISLDSLLKAGKGKGTQLYDVMIKLGDNTIADAEKDKGSYKEGDVVAVVPAGHSWSETERKSFLIAQMYLTDKQAQELMQPKEISSGADKNGRPISKMARIRAKGIDLKRFGLAPNMKNREAKINQIRKAIKDKTLSPIGE